MEIINKIAGNDQPKKDLYTSMLPFVDALMNHKISGIESNIKIQLDENNKKMELLEQRFNQLDDIIKTFTEQKNELLKLIKEVNEEHMKILQYSDIVKNFKDVQISNFYEENKQELQVEIKEPAIVEKPLIKEKTIKNYFVDCFVKNILFGKSKVHFRTFTIQAYTKNNVEINTSFTGSEDDDAIANYAESLFEYIDKQDNNICKRMYTIINTAYGNELAKKKLK